MTDQNPTEIAPDHEERHRLAVAVLEHLGITSDVEADSLRIMLGSDAHHHVSWTGFASMTTEELDGILTSIRPARTWSP